MLVGFASERQTELLVVSGSGTALVACHRPASPLKADALPTRKSVGLIASPTGDRPAMTMEG